MPQSIAKGERVKPAKPHPDFPLFAHATGRWAKKIRQKLHYFGPWNDADGALQRYLDQRDDLHAGRTPRVAREGLTVAEACNRFLTSKRHLLDSGEIVQRTWRDYYVVCDRIVKVLGRNRLVDDLAASDFAALRASFAETRGPVALTGDITRVRSVFKFAYDEGLIDRPVRFGQSFKRPGRRVLRKARHSNGDRMFEPGEIRALVDAAGSQLRAMILLGVNCGFGNNDVGALPVKAVDLESGWITFPRPKTGIDRRCPLWPETAQALRELHRKGRGFYALRHVFETIGGDSRDQVAVDHIMGHSPDARDMSAVYRERIADDRLRAVVDHVHRWLYTNPETK